MNSLIPEFWMVWKENGGEPSHRHATLETAKAEAERLARVFPGSRFFVLYAVFVLGMSLTCLAGTIETLFTGWELVGLSSVLLVAFFHERPAPVENALRVWIVYRVSDAALLLAAIRR